MRVCMCVCVCVTQWSIAKPVDKFAFVLLKHGDRPGQSDQGNTQVISPSVKIIMKKTKHVACSNSGAIPRPRLISEGDPPFPSLPTSRAAALSSDWLAGHGCYPHLGRHILSGCLCEGCTCPSAATQSGAPDRHTHTHAHTHWGWREGGRDV